MMTSKQRMVCALDRGQPDRLPVTTHHVMDYFLRKYLHGASTQEFFDQFGLDPINWVNVCRPNPSAGDYYDPLQLSANNYRRISSDQWRIFEEDVPGQKWPTKRFRFVTPKGELSMVMQFNEFTGWVSEHLIKEKSDIDLIRGFVTTPLCDTETVNREARAYGERGLVRSHICCFDIYGQPGTWQDAACLVGVERLIVETYDDPEWVHELLSMLQQRKLTYTRSLKGAAFDVVEFGGGDASSTVISPAIFDEFVAPYDAPIIAAAHEAGQRIVYHTCGGMMPILERIAAMQPDAMETFTPAGMGGDTDLAEAKRRIGDKVCMIGGMDQLHFFTGCAPEQTRAEVRRCFETAGAGGGFILSPSDHFFEADLELLHAYVDEATKCLY
jgi:hypothetical protein